MSRAAQDQVISLIEAIDTTTMPLEDPRPFVCSNDGNGQVVPLEFRDGSSGFREFELVEVEGPVDEHVLSTDPKLWSAQWGIRILYPLDGDHVHFRRMAGEDARAIHKVLANSNNMTAGIDNLFFEEADEPRFELWPDADHPRAWVREILFRVEFWE